MGRERERERQRERERERETEREGERERERERLIKEIHVETERTLVCRKIHLMEGSDGNIHLRNLSLHPAANEEEG